MKQKNNISKETITFWTNLPKPFFVLAPMANVTDSAFRKMIAKYGKPDVTWTEFVSADGLVSAGRKNLLHDLAYSEKERPIVAQIFSGHPEAIMGASKIVAKMGFDGIDINMGCPDRAVEKQGGGASIMKNPKLAVELINAAREGVAVAGKKNIPISVKCRIGYNKVDMEWIKLLLSQNLPALTVHLRTRKEMSDVPAHWDLMPDIIKMRNEISPRTLVIGNGDIVSLEQGRNVAEQTGCDGIMVGRGIFGKPWFFSGKVPEPLAERLKIMVEHAKLFEKTFKGIKSFDVMKKHFKAYVSGWDGAKELRVELMGTKNAKEVEQVIRKYLKGLRE